LKARLKSASDHHLTIAFEDFTVVGCYFRPGLEMDTISAILIDQLRAVPNPERVIVGGDLNLRVDSDGFREVATILESAGLSQNSNPATDTYFHFRGSSAIDHIFTTTGMGVINCQTKNLGISDHATVFVKLSVPRNSQPSMLSDDKSRFFNIDACVANLEELVPDEDMEVDVAANRIATVFDKNELPPKPPKKLLKHPWYTGDHKSMREEMLDQLHKYRTTKDPQDAGVYSLLRGAYHRALKSAETLFKTTQLNSMLESAKGGFTNLFPLFRRRQNTNAIDTEVFYEHCNILFNSNDVHEPQTIPTCQAEFHPLLAEFTMKEIEDTISNFHSKATSTIGISPHFLKGIVKSISPHLKSVFNKCVSSTKFPLRWLESKVFFIHKKGPQDNPNNFRSIAIQNPYLKTFMSMLTKRLSNFAEDNNILPLFQFGFRKHRSCVGAATTLFEAVNSRLNSQPKSLKTFACFVDFSKCFDTIRRDILHTKLQAHGIPLPICNLLLFIHKNLQFFIRSGNHLSKAFKTNIGLPQGCSLSPLLFSIFAADLPDFLTHSGVVLNNIAIPYIQFADDLVLLATTAADLQRGMNNLLDYCKRNGLSVNISKTKAMIFHKGRKPKHTFFLDNQEIEQVSSFVYLGFTFTTQLSFSKHVSSINSKAASKCGFLFSKILTPNIPLHVALDLFNCYVLPSYRYGLSLWLGRASEASMCALNAVFSKFLKRYLGVNYHTSNSITHFLTNTAPLTTTLKSLYDDSFTSLSFPTCLHGLKLSRCDNSCEAYDPVPLVPTHFWRSSYNGTIPVYQRNRRLMCRELYDLHHFDICTNERFHPKPEASCMCWLCGNTATNYHQYFCPELQ